MKLQFNPTPKYVEMKSLGYYIPKKYQEEQEIVFKSFCLLGSQYTNIATAYSQYYKGNFSEPMYRVLISFAYGLNNINQFGTVDEAIKSSHVMASNILLAKYNILRLGEPLSYIIPKPKYLEQWVEYIYTNLYGSASILATLQRSQSDNK